MVLKRKKSEDYSRDFKTISGVFDEKTRLSLYKLLNKKKIQIQSLVKEGKESIVFSGLTEDEKEVAIKVYRTRTMDFKTISKYLLGDPRFQKVSRSRRNFIYIWCRREFKNLQIASRNDVNCPKPIDCSENSLIMDFIGKDGTPSPRIIDVKLDQPQKTYDLIINEIKKLSKAKLIHGDLSVYNILFDGLPILIDFSHTTTPKNPIAPQLLRRDVENINSYFTKLNIRVIDSEKLYKDLIKLLGIKEDD
ncbi:MAG: serine protein kinase RIO [Candidatus Aenigmarchaeota archaeon]|nr:serine protein kinase RIO [Candidatus Aenigmarchaeota archaeon]